METSKVERRCLPVDAGRQPFYTVDSGMSDLRITMWDVLIPAPVACFTLFGLVQYPTHHPGRHHTASNREITTASDCACSPKVEFNMLGS